MGYNIYIEHSNGVRYAVDLPVVKYSRANIAVSSRGADNAHGSI